MVSIKFVPHSDLHIFVALPTLSTEQILFVKSSFFHVPCSSCHFRPKFFSEKFSDSNYLITQLSHNKVVEGKVACSMRSHILSTWKTFYDLLEWGIYAI